MSRFVSFNPKFESRSYFEAIYFQIMRSELFSSEVKSNSRRLLSNLSPNLIPRNFDLCSTILFGSVFSNGILSMSSSNKFYPTWPNISCPNRIQNPVSTAILKCHDSPSPTKNPNADQISGRFIFESRVGNYFRAKSNQTLGRINRSIVRSSKL